MVGVNLFQEGTNYDRLHTVSYRLPFFACSTSPVLFSVIIFPLAF
ncbi:MAG TPA: hypothetical protein DEB17_07920 [Chlorobaculum sp.]|uniref:Uncharacterized protein n=1 Tax=Chlorobaculum tepidum (strain ATCC 49652 / DSM 12025 / NBRC 103806 / TLS) TaxID=194439 RepID=Q8KD26_CHLTE|nr:hypothetical protein CT1230 [Chlorobaculum tepidum TLS]HBU23899.1 hypothetical protein [Chlorobaculum sp.]